MAQVEVPGKWKLSSKIRNELPVAQRADAPAHLWSKSAGICALCNEPLPSDGKGVDVDHRLATAQDDGGATVLANLYLAHGACNRSRKNLPFDLAHRIITFARWAQGAPRRTFTDVVKHFLKENGNKRAVIEENTGDRIRIRFGSVIHEAPLFSDPATGTPYFFMDVPVAFIRNDDASQPRVIEHDHVRTLAQDFSIHPVHEPSNCRVVPVGDGGLVDLLQFDGQHKTTAQIVLGRKQVPMKFYLEPSEPMIQELVVQIQQGIKKRPLSTTDTLKKLGDVYLDKVDEYRKSHDGRAPSESDLVDSQPKQDQNRFKKQLINNFEFLIRNEDDLGLGKHVATKGGKGTLMTDTVLINKLIRPLVCQDLLDEPLDEARQRDTERGTVVWMLNLIYDRMLGEEWTSQKLHEDSLESLRARNFFYQGAIGWWLGQILLPAIEGTLFPKTLWKRKFLEPLDDLKRERIESFVDTLCSWECWSTQDETQLAALRSNTLANVERAFADYDQLRLITESNS